VTSESTQFGQPAPAGKVSTSELIDRLVRFQGPPQEFLANLLAVQCHLASVPCGAVLRAGSDGRAEVVAAFPPIQPGQTAPVWLAEAAQLARDALAKGQTTVHPLHSPDDLYGQSSGKHLVLIPLRGEQGVRGLAAFVAAGESPPALRASQDRLELSMSLLSMYEMRLTLQQRQADMRRLRLAMEVSAAVGGHDRFVAGAMALCNEVASQLQCDRVSLGFLRGRYVRCRAISHTENFSRKMKIVQDIESAMEECLDQDVEVAFPPSGDATTVSRAAGELSQRHGPTTVISLPIRKGDEPRAVLTCERPADRPMALAEVESLRLAVDLCTPRLVSLHDGDRWFGARAAAAVRKAPAAALGSKHTWIKVAAIAVFAVVASLVFAKGDHTVDATFVTQAVEQRIVPAPFQGFLESVGVDENEEIVGVTGEPTWVITDQDVTDWAGLVIGLRLAGESERDSARKSILSRMGPSTRDMVTAIGDANPDEKQQAALLAELNRMLTIEGLYDAETWIGVDLSRRQRKLLADQAAGALPPDRLTELNRLLLASAMPKSLAPGPTVLAELDTSEIRLELAGAEAERQGYAKRAAAAMRDGKISDAHIARAEIKKINARIDLLRERVRKARIYSRISGTIVSRDLKQLIGSPVETGVELFKVAPLENLRAELSVSENDIADVAVGQRGELATASAPGTKIAFQVERITPVATVDTNEKRNVFRVRVRLLDPEIDLLPGQKGLAKIKLGRRRYAWMWSRKAVNWVRMKLWI